MTLACILFGLITRVPAQDYHSQGKRDPFFSLYRAGKEEAPQIAPPPPLDQRPPGLPGLLISEVNVTGIASNSAAQIVLLRGTDNFTYFARVGSKLFDGYLEEVSQDKVTFVREVIDTRGNKKTTRVVKRLYTEEQVTEK